MGRLAKTEAMANQRLREQERRARLNTHLLPHDIGGLHDAAGGQAVVSGQQDGLLQRRAQRAAVGQRGRTRGQALDLHIHHNKKDG